MLVHELSLDHDERARLGRSPSERAFALLRDKDSAIIFRTYETLTKRLLTWEHPPPEIVRFWDMLRSEIVARMELGWIDLIERFERLLSEGPGRSRSACTIKDARRQILERMREGA